MVAIAGAGGTGTEELIVRGGPHRLRYNGPSSAVPGAIYNCFRSGGLPSGPIDGLVGFSRLSDTQVQVINALRQVQTVTDVPTTSPQPQAAMLAFRNANGSNPFTGRCRMLLTGGAIDLTTAGEIFLRLDAVMVAL
jgi:hypothetical protein